MSPVARNILIACIAGFLLQQVGSREIVYNLALWPLHDYAALPHFQPWQLVTYAFLHGDIVHLFFNMFALFMFGPAIEELMGRKRFLTYYVVCVITAALAQLAVLKILDGFPAPTVGASGGIFGLLLAYGMYFPKRQVMLIFFPVPMPAWLFVTLYGAFELYLGLFGRNSSVAHFAHLGGMAGGFALIYYWRSQRLIRR